ncbi:MULTISPECIES: response regulator transcription factor [unclassified Sphingobium]|uniref:response regulator transcription factor n=1 Tax=unclassified Sphingobium TaxID=2611147 RepID=UPI000D173322|nr:MULTISPECIES: response regulator [unclassified Sphingobium]MBG6117701.1 two-component system response regulator FixJ [Sphingobium sp. JAI105]PSO12772.1 DNA-binding response regulator [Sphingobium sp. AEW4]TWD09971.1 LuxR family two component transcriptional regulator [Sphingobium sp. AEW010]TWD26642.1 LuxR family two component transcriptional regulator [Sphingobium sp. AEW013]TWD27589.1 LuxR family two component transcriptional regulator [Sphingobium sp. AEW001]
MVEAVIEDKSVVVRTASATPAPATATQNPEAVRRVYIVDDDSMVRRSLSFTLTTAGFVTRAFMSGRDFLDEIGSLSTGCVLLDVRMPDMDGIAVLEELGRTSLLFPAVIMTGHGDIPTAVRAMKQGADDFIEKPFTDAALLEMLEALFANLPARLEAQVERMKAQASVTKLTAREKELLQGLVAGLSNKEVAIRLNISVRTVEMHRSNLMNRLGVHTFAELVGIALMAQVKPLQP